MWIKYFGYRKNYGVIGRISVKGEEWNYAPSAIKYPQAETEDTGFLPVDNVEKLQAEKTFTDFQHIPRPHSYQQITIYAIF